MRQFTSTQDGDQWQHESSLALPQTTILHLCCHATLVLIIVTLASLRSLFLANLAPCTRLTVIVANLVVMFLRATFTWLPNSVQSRIALYLSFSYKCLAFIGNTTAAAYRRGASYAACLKDSICRPYFDLSTDNKIIASLVPVVMVALVVPAQSPHYQPGLAIAVGYTVYLYRRRSFEEDLDELSCLHENALPLLQGHVNLAPAVEPVAAMNNPPAGSEPSPPTPSPTARRARILRTPSNMLPSTDNTGPLPLFNATPPSESVSRTASYLHPSAPALLPTNGYTI
ncbi:hypothetical protein C8R43DRAFT_978438 [Mycena crocata]|nr:hypothetical protein C8R43DRAFT_978438 [Mycena crocata]